jgi:putative membrane protein
MSSLGVFLRGLLMGAADIVPGVSGGTIAFITGIYDELLTSIRAVDITFVRKLLKLDIAGAWQHVNGGFLLALVLGIATSVFSLARVISWLLEHHPVPLWAFFFGLILASAFVLLRQVDRWSIS